MDINKKQFVYFLDFCKGLFEKEDILWENIQDVTIEEDVKAHFPEDRKGIKVTFTVSSNFIHNADRQVWGPFEELRRREAYKPTGEGGEPKIGM